MDVVVIGAGIHGASAAYHLATRGASVVVVERGYPASGPTGRSSAVCRANYTNTFLAEVARDSIAMLADLGEHTGGRHGGFRRTGFLYLHSARDADEVRSNAARLNALGITVDLLDPSDVALEFPAFDTEGIGIATFERDAGYADPVLATVAILDAARDRGALVRTRTEVRAIVADEAGGWEVETAEGGTLACDRVLIAGGPWSRPLAATLGVELPLTVERHTVAVGAWGTAEPLPFSHADIEAGYYFKPEGESLYLVGGLTAGAQLAHADELRDGLGDAESLELLQRVARRVPALTDSTPRGGWASLYDVSPDWQPVIGEIAPGVFIDAGTSGHGFKLAPMLGAHVADLVLGQPDARLAAFDAARFAAGKELAAGYGAARIIG